MSEYQSYEFVAVDGPISDEGLLPPIPGGLDRLSPALAALIQQFPVDRDALAVAASNRTRSTATPQIKGTGLARFRSLMAWTRWGRVPLPLN